MQASLPAAAPTPAAAQMPQVAQPQATGAPKVSDALLLFEAVIGKALGLAGAVQADQSATPATNSPAPQQAGAQNSDQAATATAQSDAPPQPAVPIPTPATQTAVSPQPLPLPLPLPLPEASAATEQVPLAAGHPAATTTRKGDASNRQRPAQAGASAQAVASVILSVQGMPLAAPPNEPAASPATAAKPHPLTPAIETATAAAKNPVNGAPTPHVAAPEAVEPQPAAPNGPAPAAHDGVGVQATLPARPEAQLAADPSSALLAASTPPAPAAAAGPIAATAAAPPRTPAASPAEQVAPALVSLAHAPDGTQRLTLRLDPPDLGHVQIRIDRPPEAPARVDITVEKAETLTLLLRDQPQLQRALDQAGVPPDGRSVTFHVASTEPTARHEAVSAPSAGTGSAGTGDASYGASQQGGGPPRREFAGADDPDTEFSQAAPPGWVRAGLDITA